MLHKCLVFILLSISIYANSLDELLVKLQNNSSLINAQKSSVMAKQKDISIQTSYKNPKLSFGANDILLNKDKYDRFDLEPMQTQYIAISQEFEDTDRLDSKKTIALYALKKENLVLEDLTYDLLKQLRQINLQISKTDEIIKLVDKKLSNLETLKQYFTNTTNTMVNISLFSKVDEKIYKTKEQKYNLLTKIDNLKNSYLYILGEEYKHFDDTLENLRNNGKFELTPKYRAIEIEQNIAKEQIKSARLEKSPNITFNAAYNRRENFDDYINLSIAFPLPVYGTEDEKVVKNSEIYRKNSFIKDDFLRKVTMKYENLSSKVLFLTNSLNDIVEVLNSMDSQLNYSHESFEALSNTPQIIESKNLKIDYHIKEIQLKEQIDFNTLEIDYITTKSKL